MTSQMDYDVVVNEKFILKGRLSASEHFVEGVTQLLFGFPITKVLLHTVIEPSSGGRPEIRRAEQYLSMPTVKAVELAHLILKTAKQSESRLLGELTGNAKENLRSLLNDFQSSASPQILEIEETTRASKVGSKK